MNVGVIIGRFQPFHNGHADLLKTASKDVDKIVVVLGSSNRHQSIKNPFTVLERKTLITEWANNNLDIPIDFVESVDNLYKEWTWKADIIRKVYSLIPRKADVKLYGHFKDNSSYYLNEFPEWELCSVDSFGDIDATTIRHDIMNGEAFHYMNTIPKETKDFLWKFADDIDRYMNLKEEHQYYIMEKDKFKNYPYPETLNFMCSDAVVVCKGHILLVERAFAPGKGTYALPGGFKNNNETLQECCIRELKEETNLRIPEKVLIGSIKDVKMFDNPSRNIGIPRVTAAHYIEVDTDFNGSLPEVRPSSDAQQAKWFELSAAMAENLFDDHEDIIKAFV